MSIEIYDNFLEKEDFSNLQSLVAGDNFPWYYNTEVVVGIEKEPLKNHQLTHTLYRDNVVCSQLWGNFYTLINKINPFLLYRMKLNCNFYAQDRYEHGMHIDIHDAPQNTNLNLKTAIFYINTNDGYTRMESTNEKIQSVENRLVVFDYKERHTGCTPTDAQARFVLNINYIPH